MKELVSVIITCYNHEKYIKQCMQSVYRQTYQNIELLIINDGSTDYSDKIISKHLPDSPFNKTEYIVQENEGVCITRNNGLEWASGDFLLFVDSDNYLDEDYIERLLKTAISEDADIVYADLVNVDTGEVFKKAKIFELRTYFEENYIDNCSLIRRDKIKDVRYDIELNRKKLVDYDFFLKLIINNEAKPCPCNDDSVKLNYRVLEESISRQKNHNSTKFYYETYTYIISKYMNRYPKFIVNGLRKNMIELEDRLEDLIEHLNNVDEVIKGQSDLIEKEIKEKDYLNNLFQNEIKELSQQIAEEKNANNFFKQEIEMIRHSVSYKVGNCLVKPLSLLKRLLQDPRVVTRLITRIKIKLKKRLNKFHSPKTYFLQFFRNIQRKKYKFAFPKRLLIYVIYENESRIQQYKLIFLENISKLVGKIVIVVNGNISDNDCHILKKYGTVYVRKNEGYDAAAFRYGINILGQDYIKTFDELLLINDTIIGPLWDMEPIIEKMALKNLDFWGMTLGEKQTDSTGVNPYGFIPLHLQSYFIVIEKSLLNYSGFYEYWNRLSCTDSREQAIGYHETVFTKYFADLGFKYQAFVSENKDSPMYIHPLKMVELGIPLIKYSALANYSDEKFTWYNLKRKTEIPTLVDYVAQKTDYPISVINKILENFKNKNNDEYVLIIDGVENAIPQLTTYRVKNKVEQLESLGFKVKCIGLSKLRLNLGEYASHIIIYRAPYTEQLGKLVELATLHKKPVIYDIDDLVIDTKYTNQLEYVKNLSANDKQSYSAGVISYGKMMLLCDIASTSTKKLKNELLNYKTKVLLNRNLVSKKLVEISQKNLKNYELNNDDIVKIGYFSGSISHNENFNMIKNDLKNLLEEYPKLELHLVGYLDIPEDIKKYKNQIVIHSFVAWQDLPRLISEVDINLAPLVDSIFNQSKSEIKWLEAALVKVPTVASNIGGFSETVLDGDTGVLASDHEWYNKLKMLIESKELRKTIAESAHQYVLEHCTTNEKVDELVEYIYEKNNG